MVSVVSSAYTRCTLVANLSCGFPEAYMEAPPINLQSFPGSSKIMRKFNCLALSRSLSNFVYLLSKIATSFWALCLVSQQSFQAFSTSTNHGNSARAALLRMMKMYWPAKVRDLHGWCPNRALGRENVNTSITHFGQPHHCERWTLSIFRGEKGTSTLS